MFSLAYPLNETVEIDGTTYTIDMSFDKILRLIDMLNDDELPDAVQIVIGLEMLLGVQLEYDLDKQAEIFYQLYENLVDKEEDDEQLYDIEGNPMPKLPKEKDVNIYDIKQDAEYIYASFMQDYGIDLIEQQGKLHWDKFKALLAGLREDTKFKKVLEIRQMPLPTGKGTEKQRRQMLELKRNYAIKGDDIDEFEDS